MRAIHNLYIKHTFKIKEKYLKLVKESNAPVLQLSSAEEIRCRIFRLGFPAQVEFLWRQDKVTDREFCAETLNWEFVTNLVHPPQPQGQWAEPALAVSPSGKLPVLWKIPRDTEISFFYLQRQKGEAEQPSRALQGSALSSCPELPGSHFKGLHEENYPWGKSLTPGDKCAVNSGFCWDDGRAKCEILGCKLMSSSQSIRWY